MRRMCGTIRLSASIKPAEMLMLRWDDRTEADTTWAQAPAGVDVEIALP